MYPTRSAVEDNWRRTEDGWRLLPGVFVGTGSERASEPASVLTRARNSRSISKTSKTESNNTVRLVRIAGASRPHDGTSQERCDSLVPIRQPHLTGIQGIAADRRISCGLTTSIEHLEMTDITLEVSGIRYCCEIFELLFEQKIGKISGTTQRLIFRVLGEVVSECLINETNISLMKRLLKKASESISDINAVTAAGSKSLWKRHRDAVSNLTTLVETFQYTQREDDGLPQLLDMPKECILYILERLTDPRDLLNVGTTCSYLHDLVADRFLWQQMCLFHFTDKQLYQYICDDEYLGIDWFKAFQLCYKKPKCLRVVYANELHFCNRCRAVYWKNLGHPCRNPEETPSSSPLLPKEFVDMLHL